MNTKSVLPTTQVKKQRDTPFALLRGAMQNRLHSELDIILSIQRYRTRILDYFFFLASLLGEEEFYTLLVPFCAWILQPRASLHVAFILAYGVVSGNILKNYFALPRPQSPPVWVWAPSQLSDFGFPSTHTVTSLSVSTYFVLNLFFDPETPAITLWYIPGIMSWQVAAFISFAWTFCVSFSRLYNGYHFPLDVFGGLMIGTFVVLSHFYFIRHVLEFFSMTTNILVPIFYIVTGLLIVWCHPRPPETPNGTLPESATLLGVVVGAILVGWINYVFNIPISFVVEQPLLSYLPGLQWFITRYQFIFHASRFLIGGVIAIVTRFIGKLILTEIVARTVMEFRNTPIMSQSQQDAQCLVKYFSYMLISLGVGSIAPLAFNLIGINGPRDYLLVLTSCAWC